MNSGRGCVLRAARRSCRHHWRRSSHRRADDGYGPPAPVSRDRARSRRADRQQPIMLRNRNLRPGSPSRTRTCDHSINSRMLYQLSYRGTSAVHSKAGLHLQTPIPALAGRLSRLQSARITAAKAKLRLAPDRRMLLEDRARRRHDDPPRPRGGVVTQRTANPCTPVRFRARPPLSFSSPFASVELQSRGSAC